MPEIPAPTPGRGDPTRGTPLSHRRHASDRQAGPARSATLLTIGEVLDELQVARSTFDAWRALGTAPECIKLPNGHLRIRRAALDTWLAGHVQAPAQAD